MLSTNQFEKLFDDVPNYTGFPDLYDLRERSEALVEKYPDLITSETVGYSAGGRPIALDKINDQPDNPRQKKALYVGCMHPNELVGTLTIAETERAVCANPEILDDLGDCALWFMTSADPDGMARQGYLGKEFTVDSYSDGFYRQSYLEQLEWGFPIDYRGMVLDKPIPEVRVLQRVIEQCKPDFHYSLHNAALSGGYIYATRDYPDLFKAMRQQLLQYGVPGTGIADSLASFSLAPSVFQLQGAHEIRDYSLKHGLSPYDSGRGSFEYARDYNANAFSLMPETPCFDHPEFSASGELNAREVLHATVRHLKEYTRVMQCHSEALLRLRPNDDRLRSVSMGISWGDYMRESCQTELAVTDDSRTLSRSEAFHNFNVRSFYDSLYVDQLKRIAQDAGEQTQAEELGAYRQQIIRGVEASGAIKVNPIADHVRLQATCGMLAMQHHFAALSKTG